MTAGFIVTREKPVSGEARYFRNGLTSNRLLKHSAKAPDRPRQNPTNDILIDRNAERACRFILDRRNECQNSLDQHTINPLAGTTALSIDLIFNLRPDATPTAAGYWVIAFTPTYAGLHPITTLAGSTPNHVGPTLVRLT